ncbi:MAG: TIGR03960 family B12-binding radical SAM protein [Chloroflexota bacterium]|nr:TIGR03960 family B12-binding radical SAM protein [Chloroflexota bacterium]
MPEGNHDINADAYPAIFVLSLEVTVSYPDSLIHKVTKPAQYMGSEWNSILKDWATSEVRFVLAYPDLYEVGMSNLALMILYDILNRQDGVLAERAFAPWIDMEAAMRQAGIPLLSLESGHPLREFDIVGFSLNYELTYTNVLNMLDISGIPPLAAERGETHPLIIAGGGCALNPEPMSDFIDLFVLGEGEKVILELIKDYRLWKREGGSRIDLLHQLARIPGIYVPSLYQPDYLPDGRVERITPISTYASERVQRQTVAHLPPPPTKPIVPYMEAVHDRAMIEIQRGCNRGCRFCQAGMIYRPQRQRSPQEVIEAAGQLERNCGYSELSLLSLSTTDYPGIDDMVSSLSRTYRTPPLALSLPSLRIDALSIRLMDLLSIGKKTSLTFAPEAGNERLRTALNKSIYDDEIIDTLNTALRKGWSNFKLYFLIGLPTETEQDIQSIPDIIRRINSLGNRVQPKLRINLATLIPKAHTPFQWLAQESEEQLGPKQREIKQQLRRSGVHISWSEPKTSLIEAVMSRGDRKIGKVIYKAWQSGCTFDAWNERFDYQKWEDAFTHTGLDPDFYANRQRDIDEVLPWDHIDIGVSSGFLKQEYTRTLRHEETPSCGPMQCNICGLEQQCPNVKQTIRL